MPYKVIRNCSDGVVGHLYRPGEIIEDHPQIATLLEKGTVIPYEPEPEVEVVNEAEPETKRRAGRPRKDPVEGATGIESEGVEPDPLETE